MSSSVADDKPGKVVVSGSMCFDLIMKYDGLYQEHFLPEHLDNINLSFLVDDARKERGGCSGNIGYSMALLGEHPRIKKQEMIKAGARLFRIEFLYRCENPRQRMDTLARLIKM